MDFPCYNPNQQGKIYLDVQEWHDRYGYKQQQLLSGGIWNPPNKKAAVPGAVIKHSELGNS